MLVVALVSAAIAGGSAYYLARRGTGTPPPVAASASGSVAALLTVIPPDATVSTADGPLPVVNGTATLRGQPGTRLDVTVQHQSASKTFSVSLGPDGTASPSRLVLPP